MPAPHRRSHARRGPTYENLQRRKPREVGRCCAADSMGICALGRGAVQYRQVATLVARRERSPGKAVRVRAFARMLMRLVASDKAAGSRAEHPMMSCIV